jgi:O-antigen/teichoic acid export membrane protein
MKREKNLLANTFILGVGSILPKFSTFLILPILTAYLTKTEYGLYDLILTSMSFILPIFSLQIEHAVFRYLIDLKVINERKKIITNSVVYILCASIVLLILSLIILKQYENYIKYLICVYVVLNLFYRYILQVCRGLKLLKNYSLGSIIQSFLMVLLIFVFVKEMNMGFYGLLISLVISIFIAIIFVFISSRVIKLFSFKFYDFESIKKLLSYSLPLLPNSISWWIVSVSDRWIVTAILGIEMNAIYAISNKIPSLFKLVYNNFNLAWQESASITSKDSDVREYYTNIFNYLFNFLMGMLLLLITISPLIFKIFIDEAYFLAYYQMPILFSAMLFSSLSSYYGGIYVAFKKTKSIGISSVIAALFNVLVNLVFVSKIGLYAASFSTLLSYVVLTLYRAIDIQKYIYIKYNFTKIIGLLFILTIVSIINYLNIYYLNILNFIVAVIMSIILNRSLIKQTVLKLINKFKNKDLAL